MSNRAPLGHWTLTASVGFVAYSPLWAGSRSWRSSCVTTFPKRSGATISGLCTPHGWVTRRHGDTTAARSAAANCGDTKSSVSGVVGVI